MNFWKLLKNTEWQNVSEYLSPAFFDVVNPIQSLRQVAALANSVVDDEGFQKCVKDLQQFIETSRIPVELRGARSHCVTEVGDEDVQTKDGPLYGVMDLCLDMYFVQLLRFDRAILDFRPKAFTISSPAEYLIWQPACLFVEWQPEFIKSIRGMYVGFYMDDRELFRASLKILGLANCEEIFLDHFSTSQSSLMFNLKEFRATFHRVFVTSKQAKSRIHPQFLPFGLGLATLYQTLEATGRPFDVRGAFFRAKNVVEVSAV